MGPHASGWAQLLVLNLQKSENALALLLWSHRPRGKKNRIVFLFISGQHKVKLDQREHLRGICSKHKTTHLFSERCWFWICLQHSGKEGKKKEGWGGEWGESVPLDCTEKISLSDNSSGQFQTTQNDKGINFSRLGYRWIFLGLLFS